MFSEDDRDGVLPKTEILLLQKFRLFYVIQVGESEFAIDEMAARLDGLTAS